MSQWLDYLILIRDYMPIALYMLLIIGLITFIPQSVKRIKCRAKKELKDIRYHRCLAFKADNRINCCCEKVKQENGGVSKIAFENLINELERKKTPWRDIDADSQLKFQEELEQMPKNVTQITKIFENSDKIIRAKQNVCNRAISEYFKPVVILKEDKSKNGNPSIQSCVRRPISEYFESTNITDEKNGQLKHKITCERPLSNCYDMSILSHDNDKYIERRQKQHIQNGENLVILRNKYQKQPLQFSQKSNFIQSNRPVTSIDEILEEKRLSRTLSQYSISDLVGECILDDSYVESFLNKI